MNAKSTLQSIDINPENPNTDCRNDRNRAPYNEWHQPVLPNGQIITAKNTLQSFDDENDGVVTSLKPFDIGNNNFTGTLPESIEQWTELTQFNTYNNDISGPLPNFIGQWMNLNSFFAYFNDISGPLPESIGNWTVLTTLDLTGNNLNSTLSESIGRLKELIYLDISSNSFSKRIPYSKLVN